MYTIYKTHNLTQLLIQKKKDQKLHYTEYSPLQVSKQTVFGTQ